MRPFLLLSSRAEDEAADGEYEAFLRYTGLAPRRLCRIRMEAAPLPALDLDDFSGVMVGGGPFNSSDPPAEKSAVQRSGAILGVCRALVAEKLVADVLARLMPVIFVSPMRAPFALPDGMGTLANAVFAVLGHGGCSVLVLR